MEPKRPVGRPAAAGPAPASAEALECRRLLSASLVQDVNTTPLSSNPGAAVQMGAKAYFVANDGAHGRELWSTDGTSAGTTMVKDILPGVNTSVPQYLTVAGSFLYFQAYDSPNTLGLWRTDGTAAGTVELVSHYGSQNIGLSLQSLTASSGKVFFVNGDPTNGAELWESNGTAAGTFIVRDIVTGAAGSSPTNLTDVNGTLYFTFTAPDGSQQLWKSDGTTAGTVQVPAAFDAHVTKIESLVNVNGTLYFATTDTTRLGYLRLWKSDGTGAGTTVVQTVSGSDIFLPVNVNGELYFEVDNPDGNSTGGLLYKSDGTAAGTVVVSTAVRMTRGDRVHASGDRLFFTGKPTPFDDELWTTDGTAAGTVRLADINAGSQGSTPSALTDFGGKLYFSATNADDGVELWRSDGTAAGTAFVKEMVPGSDWASQTTANYGSPSLSSALGTLLLGVGVPSSTGLELWKSDGTAAGTTLLRRINTNTNVSRSDPYGPGVQPILLFMPRAQVAVGNTVYFIASDNGNLGQLWKTTEGGAGATKIAEFGRTPAGYLTAVNGILYFAGVGPQGNLSFWRSDGTAAGTTLIGTTGTSNQYQFEWYDDTIPLVVVNDTVYFQAYDSAHGLELWKADGSPGGASMVADIRPGTASSSLGYFQPAALGNILYFVADDGMHGPKLWRSDGTAAGTWLVKDIGSFPTNLTAFNGALYFTMLGQLWKTDGTEAGTTLVKTVASSSGAVLPAKLTVAGSTLYFISNDAVAGTELWKTDGTTEGTVLVSDINPGAGSSTPDMLTNFNGKLVFIVRDSTSGPGVWITDGTAAGTVPLKGLSLPTFPKLNYTPRGVVAGGTMYFPGSTAPFGGDLELWQTDGTPAGTVQAQDIDPFGSSRPGDFLLAGDTVYFTADDGQTGRELWKMPVSALPTVTSETVGADPTGTQVRVTFSKDVATSITPDDLTLANQATPGTVFHASAAAYDPNTFTATFTFTAPGGGPLADADYLATLTGAGVYDGANKHLDGDANGAEGGDWTYTFSQLTGLAPAATGAAYYLSGPPDNKVLTVTAGTVTLTRDLSAGYPGVSLNVSGNATVYFAVDQNFASVSLSDNGAISVGPPPPPQSSGSGAVAGTPTPTPTPAPTPPSQPLVLTPSSAAYVRDGAYANTAFASDPSLVVKKGPAGYTRESFLTFDLSHVGAIHTAKLRLFGHLSQTAPKGVAIKVYAAGGALPKGRLTWNHRPAAGASTSASAAVAGTGGRWYEWDVTSLLRAARAAGARSVTLALRGGFATDAAALFDAGRTGANGPRLILA